MSPIIQSVLAYNESSLPAASFSERLQLVLQEGLTLEVANQGNFPTAQYHEIGVGIASVQAYDMHEFHPLHRDRERRIAAVRHVHETLELAAKLNVPRIVTVCGFGYELADRPFERCLDFFGAFVVRAKELGVL